LQAAIKLSVIRWEEEPLMTQDPWFLSIRCSGKRLKAGSDKLMISIHSFLRSLVESFPTVVNLPIGPSQEMAR
jgi:hypothetical protein